jgi:hypothetical protein
MTKKHFKALAEALKNLRPEDKDSAAFHMWKHSCAAVADTCRTANPRFDRARFYEACGL